MMNRRKFCKTAMVAGVGAALPLGRAVAAACQAMGKVASDIPAVTLSGAETVLERAAVAEFGESLCGTLLLAGSDGYESARKLWNGMID